MAQDKQTSDNFKAKFLADQATIFASQATKALAEVQQAGVESKPLVPFPLHKTERTAVAGLTALSADLRKKLTGRGGKFTVAEALNMVTVVSESLVSAEPGTQDTFLFAATQLLSSVHSDVLMPLWRAEAKRQKPTDLLYQLKTTLIDAQPAIWRRIQVKDCTLDKLHEHIQTAMGWTNSHLHQFFVDGQLYGDPELMEENFQELNYRDSTITLLSSILPKDDKRFQFRYEYDFGDGWQHEVLFEGRPEPEAGQKYPVCLEGERACPPEDVGGMHGYAEFLERIREGHDRERVETLEWAEGWFDPEEFDATTATKSMWKGLPDWRTMQ
jgi:hypothetical protein